MIGYVYTIVNEDESVVHIGSTTRKLNLRYNHHKCNYKRWKDGKIKSCCMIYHEFDKYGVDAFKIEVLEEVEFEDKCELYRRENHYISATNCVNKNSAPTGLTPLERNKQYRETNKDKIKQYQEEYHETNKDKIKERKKQYYQANRDKKKEYQEANKDKISERMKHYYETNKDKINEKAKQKYDCPCGSKYSHQHKARHEKTKKHHNYIINLSS